MEAINKDILKQLYRPPKNSYKGQNGKLTIIGGSSLFHGASLWALKTASRFVDMVFYSTIKENKTLTSRLKTELYDFIFVPRSEIDDYIDESDAVLIGPGMMRIKNLNNRNLEDNTYEITRRLIFKFPEKKWIIDAGSLQIMEADWLKKLKQVIITPHQKEFNQLFKVQCKGPAFTEGRAFTVRQKAKEYNCVIVLKGPIDIICGQQKCAMNKTGNQGMTKGGTGDVLAGLIAALGCKNDLFTAACAGAYINGLAGDSLFKRAGPFFNASDLCEEIPKLLKNYLP